VDVSYSREDDYTARQIGFSDAWTMAGGRGTLHYGVSSGRDLVEPVTNHLHLDRNSLSYALGWTWILGADDLFDLSASRTHLHGYLDEPYKIVPIGATTAPDHRPGDRTRDALVLKYGHYFFWDGALRTSYRFYRDDWAIRAHTLGLVYEQHLGDGWTLSPELRLYTQTGASFYSSLFKTAQPYMTSDYRMAPSDSILGGLSVGYELPSGLVLKLGGTWQLAHGRDRVTPTAQGYLPGPGAVYSGPASSAADLTKTTLTLGLSWRY
jgi:hypothetical protein